MANLKELVEQANGWLRISEIPDYPQALNGLQVENSGTVSAIAAAVDACLPVIREACQTGVKLLVVHHGLFWQGTQRIEGAMYDKLKLAMDHDLAIYSSHIPLDVHPELGNNACLMSALGLGEKALPFARWKGIDLGLRAEVSLSREELVAAVEAATGSPAHVCAGGPDRVSQIGVVTGGAGSQIYEMAATGIDTFITGEGPHWSFTSAEELGVNLIYGGHYATETFGVKALAERWCESNEGLTWSFIDHPTGL